MTSIFSLLKNTAVIYDETFIKTAENNYQVFGLFGSV